jgi:chromosome partitioning protein
MKRILIMNPKGGVGKSTLATNLAGWFALQGKQVMLGDTDRQQSSVAWLSVRSPTLPHVGSWEIQPEKPARPPKGTTHVVLDSPAGIHGKKLGRLMRAVDQVIVPIQPSLFDIFATGAFLKELLATRRFLDEEVRIAVVGMRIDAHTRAASELERFLEGTGLPVIAHLRDTQHYVQAAAHGMTLFDMRPSQVAEDLRQWQPLLRWADPLLTA